MLVSCGENSNGSTSSKSCSGWRYSCVRVVVIVVDVEVEFLHCCGELLLLLLYSFLRFVWCVSLIIVWDEGCLGEWVTIVLPDAHSPSLACLLGGPGK